MKRIFIFLLISNYICSMDSIKKEENMAITCVKICDRKGERRSEEDIEELVNGKDFYYHTYSKKKKNEDAQKIVTEKTTVYDENVEKNLYALKQEGIQYYFLNEYNQNFSKYIHKINIDNISEFAYCQNKFKKALYFSISLSQQNKFFQTITVKRYNDPLTCTFMFKPYVVYTYLGVNIKKDKDGDDYREFEWSLRECDQVNLTGMMHHIPTMRYGRGGWIYFGFNNVADAVYMDPSDLSRLEKKIEKEQKRINFAGNEEYKKTIIFNFNNSLKMFYAVHAEQFLARWKEFENKNHGILWGYVPKEETKEPKNIETTEQEFKETTEQEPQKETYLIRRLCVTGTIVAVLLLIMYKTNIFAYSSNFFKNLNVFSLLTK